MIDYTELKDGNSFELLMRDLLQRYVYNVYWTGKGIDCGKDLVLIEKINGTFAAHEEKWVVQCKNNAMSGTSVSFNDLGNVVGICSSCNASGYLIACTTQLSSSAITSVSEACENNSIKFAYWDGKKIEHELLKPQNWDLLIQYFPISSKIYNFSLNIIEPGFWCSKYKDSIVYVSSRISANLEYTIEDVKKIIDGIDSINKNNDYIIKCRALFFDDKNCNVHLYIDVIYFNEMVWDDKVKNHLEDLIFNSINPLFNLSDIDLEYYICDKFSDHFDINHHDFYDKYLGLFKHGVTKSQNSKTSCIKVREDRITEDVVWGSFERLCGILNKMDFIKILNSFNSNIENINQFTDVVGWGEEITDQGDFDALFFPYIIMEISDIQKFEKLLEIIPKSVEHHIELSKKYVICPGDKVNLSIEDNIYIMRIKILEFICVNSVDFRLELNKYLDEMSEKISKNYNIKFDEKKE